MTAYPETSTYIQGLKNWMEEILPSSKKEYQQEKAHKLTVYHSDADPKWVEEVVSLLSEEFPLYSVSARESRRESGSWSWVIRTNPEHELVEKQATRLGAHLSIHMTLKARAMTLKVISSTVKKKISAKSIRWDAESMGGQGIGVNYRGGTLYLYVSTKKGDQTWWEPLHTVSVGYDRDMSWADVVELLGLEEVDE